MAARYAVATGNWDSTSIWSTTDGGGSGASVPTSADDVYFTLLSGVITVTMNVAISCRSINCTGFIGTLNSSGSLSHNIGDGTAGAGNVALKLVSGMTTGITSATVTINFISTSATQQTIESAGKTLSNITFNGAGSSYILSDALTLFGNCNLTVTQGTFNSNGYTITATGFNSSNANTRTLTFGSSSILLSGTTATTWTTGTGTNLTITANTATVTLSGSTGGFTSHFNADYNGLSVVFSGSSSQTLSASGLCTLANFTRTGTAAVACSLTFTGNLTCTGTFTSNGNSTTNRVLVNSSVTGTARTITAATVSVSYSDFMDITGAGAGSWDLSAITGGSGDCLGNSGITFTTPVTQTWSGTSGGNWSANAWTTRIPLPQDDVVINAAFVASQTVTSNMPRMGKNIDWSGSSGNPTWSKSISNTCFGSITLNSGVGISWSGGFNIMGRGTHTIDLAGKSIQTGVAIDAFGGSYTLLSDFVLTGSNTFYVYSGGFNSNGYNMTAGLFSLSGTGVRSITMGSSTWTTATTGTVWSLATTTNLTFSGESGIVVIGGASASARTFAGGGLTYGTLRYTVAGSTGKLTITGANSFNSIEFSDVTNARTLEFTASTTTTIRSASGWLINGTSGKLMTVTSATASTHTISCAFGIVSSDYLSLSYSTASGGAGFYAGENSTNGGNNNGWTFSAAPVVSADYDASDQVMLNRLNSSGDYQYTLQEIANAYNSTGEHTLSLQEVLNTQAGRSQHSMSEQEALFANLATPLSLTGPATKYSVQELLKMAIDNGLSLATVLG